MNIQLKKISYSLTASHFKEKLIFRDFSLDINRDTNFSITKVLLPNNYGKSSLLKLMAGIIKPSSGEVVVSSDIKKIVYIPSLPATFNFATVEQNIEHILSFAELKLADVKDEYKTLVEISDLSGYEDHRPDPLSFGFRFRIMIIASILAGAQCILLDDIFSHLDSPTASELKELIEILAEKYSTWFIEV